MDSYEATRIVFSRVTKLDPENASKIMGLLLIQDHGEKEMIRLAFGPENFLHSVILKARKDLGLTPISNSSKQLSPLSIPNPSSSSPNEDGLSLMNNTGFFGHGGPDHVLEDASSPSNASDYGLLNHRRSYSVSDAACLDDPNAAGFGWKPCLYYARGYCKNGAGCRFLHGGGDDGGALPPPPPLVGSPSKVEMMEQHHEAAAALMRSKSVQQQRLAAALNSFQYSSKCMSFLLQHQQQTEAQR